MMHGRGDKEWRRFGEAAAIIWGVRALTGWDPLGEIIDYPRRRIVHKKEMTYQKPTYVYIQNQPRNDKISAFPPSYSIPPGYDRSTNSLDHPEDEYPERQNAKPSMEYPNEKYISPESETTVPNRENAKPPVLISKHVEGNYEIVTKRIWIEPHWEKKIIEAHWEGDTWISTHWEKNWVEGQWKVVEKKIPLEGQDEDAVR